MKKQFTWIPDKVPEDLKGLIKTIPEEIANMISHGVGLVFFLISIPFLLKKSFDSSVKFGFESCLIFSISILMVYFSSTIYHSVFNISLKKRLRVIDHICIYFLIAGSFTPFIVLKVPTDIGKTVLTTQWSMVVVGSVFKYFFTHKFKVISVMAYICMGAMAILILDSLSKNVSIESLNCIKFGGFSYLFGVIFYLWKKLYLNHFYWHICVLSGSISIFYAVWLML